MLSSQYRRNKALFDKELIPKADLEASETEVQVAQSALQQAKERQSLVKEGVRPEEISGQRILYSRKTGQFTIEKGNRVQS